MNDEVTRDAYRVAVEAMATLSVDELAFLSIACHGVACVDAHGRQDLALLLYDGPFRVSALAEMFADIKGRMFLVALACFGPFVDAAERGIHELLLQQGLTPVERQPDDAWERWFAVARAGRTDTLAATAAGEDVRGEGLLVLSASSSNEVALQAPQGAELPPFTEVLLDSLPLASSYEILEALMRVPKVGSTPTLARSRATPAFAAQKPLIE